jgi:hypothetical protein
VEEEIKMEVNQWADKEWKEFEERINEVFSVNELAYYSLLNLTREQEEHPEWYDSPCLCQLCCSYGD